MQEDKIVIREVVKEDNRLLAKTIRNVFEESDSIPKQDCVYSDPATDHLFEWFRKPGSVLWVAVINDKIEGCCGIYPTEGLDKNCVELVKFYLGKEARGKGVGKKLMNKSIESARQLGYEYLYLESFPQFATAVGMYGKQGFKKLEHPLGNSGHSACSIWMIKEL